MRYLTLLFISFVLLVGGLHAQEVGYGLGTAALGRRVINKGDTIYSFYVLKPTKPIKTHLNRLYYWFRNDTIMTTVGDYDGWVLNGTYKIFYPDKNLRESGSFHNGLKEGEWKIWYSGGRLQNVANWRDGELNGWVVEYFLNGNESRLLYKNGKVSAKKGKENQTD